MSQPFAPARTALFERLWAAQGGRCAICGGTMPAHRFETAHATLWKKQRPTLDHIRPRAKGGRDDAGNLRLAHAACNKARGDTWAG